MARLRRAIKGPVRYRIKMLLYSKNQPVDVVESIRRKSFGTRQELITLDFVRIYEMQLKKLST